MVEVLLLQVSPATWRKSSPTAFRYGFTGTGWFPHRHLAYPQLSMHIFLQHHLLPLTPAFPLQLDCFLVLQMSANTIWTVANLEQRKYRPILNLQGCSLHSASLASWHTEMSLSWGFVAPNLLTDFGLPEVGCRTRAVLMRLFLATVVCPK